MNGITADFLPKLVIVAIPSILSILGVVIIALMNRSDLKKRNKRPFRRSIKRATEKVGYWKMRLEVESLLERPLGQRKDLKAIAQQAIERCDIEVCEAEAEEFLDETEEHLWKEYWKAEEQEICRAEEKKGEISRIRYWLMLYWPRPIQAPQRRCIWRRPALSRNWKYVDALASWIIRCALYAFTLGTLFCFAIALWICGYFWVLGGPPARIHTNLLTAAVGTLVYAGYAVAFRLFLDGLGFERKLFHRSI